jgi:hypothetical protein
MEEPVATAKTQPDYGSTNTILLQESTRSNDDVEQPVLKPAVYAPPSIALRLVILFCICCLTFGSYWVFDTPGAIPTKLKDWFAQKNKVLTDADILLFYSIYSWPNTVLALFGGVIVDKITGMRLGALLFCFFILFGEHDCAKSQQVSPTQKQLFPSRVIADCFILFGFFVWFFYFICVFGTKSSNHYRKSHTHCLHQMFIFPFSFLLGFTQGNSCSRMD